MLSGFFLFYGVVIHIYQTILNQSFALLSFKKAGGV